MAGFSQPDIDRILDNYNQSFEYACNEQKLKKRKLFINDLVDKFSSPRGGGSVSPYSHTQFATRVATFDSARWFAKPTCISAFECARRGWQSTATDTLTCGFCRSKLVHEASDKSGERLVEMLTMGHKSFCGWGTNTCPPEFCSIYYSTSNCEALYQGVWDKGILPVCSTASGTTHCIDILKIEVSAKDIGQWKHYQTGSHSHADSVKLVESLLRLVTSQVDTDHDRSELARLLTGLLQYKSSVFSSTLFKLVKINDKLAALTTGDSSSVLDCPLTADDVILLRRFLKTCLLGIFGWTYADSQIAPGDGNSAVTTPCSALRCNVCSRSVSVSVPVTTNGTGESCFDLLFKHKSCCPFSTQCNIWSCSVPTGAVPAETSQEMLPGWLVYAHMFMDRSL